MEQCRRSESELQSFFANCEVSTALESFILWKCAEAEENQPKFELMDGKPIAELVSMDAEGLKDAEQIVKNKKEIPNEEIILKELDVKVEDEIEKVELVLEEDDMKVWNCDKCDKSFRSRSTLEKHEERHENKKVCRFCQKEFSRM